jgi:hypothetical protein
VKRSGGAAERRAECGRQRNLAVLLGIALWTIIGGISAPGKTLYVNGGQGLDSADGAKEHPWKTIQRAANSARPGDIVLIAAGAYPERIRVTHSGSAGQVIQYRATGRVVTGGFQVLADYNRIAGFEVTSYSRLYDDNNGIYVHGQHNEILRNYIHDIYNTGIMLSADGSSDGVSTATAHNVVRGNRIYRASGCGIYIDGLSNLIEQNDISRIVQYLPGSPFFEGADADGLRPFGTGHIIRGNRVHDIRIDDLGNLDPHIDCIESWGPASNILFERNICDVGESSYIPVQGAQIENGSGYVGHLLFRNNEFVHVRIGIHLEKLGSSELESIEIEHNRFSHITHQAVLIEGPATGVIQNNAFSDVGTPREGDIRPESSAAYPERGPER